MNKLLKNKELLLDISITLLSKNHLIMNQNQLNLLSIIKARKPNKLANKQIPHQIGRKQLTTAHSKARRLQLVNQMNDTMMAKNICIKRNSNNLEKWLQ